MNNWQKVKIKDITDKIVDNRGKTPKNNAECGIPLLEVNALSETKKTPTYEVVRKYVDSETYNNAFRSGHPQKGDILIPTVGTIGNVCIADHRQCCIAQNVIGLRTNKDLCEPEYLYYTLKDKTTQRRLLNLDIGGVQPSIKVPHLLNLEILLPDIFTQQRIARILSSLDDKIELNAQINHNLEEQLYALYASNYDNLSGKKVPLKECCSFQEGYVNPTQTKPEYFDGSVKWLRAVDINESFIISTSRTLTEQGFASAGKSALLFPKDSIAISKSGTIGRLGIVADNMCGNRAVINIVPKQKKWLAFIYCYLKSRQAEFSDLAVGSVQKNLYVSILEPLEIFSPADSVLNDFHFSAQTILEKMKNNCFEMQSLAQLRDALLPKLMSGEIDVSEVEV